MRQWIGAFPRGDTETLDRILSDDFISADPEGRLIGKAEWVADMTSGELVSESIHTDDLRVRVYGDSLQRVRRWRKRPAKHPSNRRRKIMSCKNRMLATFALVALTLGLFSPSQTVSAVNNCHKVKGNLSAVNNFDGTVSGTITQGGRLNGTTLAALTSPLPFTPTPDPFTVTFTDDFTLTTRKGVLAAHNVTLLDLANGLISAIARIDPSTSTGDFEGATGVLFFNGRTADGAATFQGEIRGEICFAN